jgi:hypothetical protein
LHPCPPKTWWACVLGVTLATTLKLGHWWRTSRGRMLPPSPHPPPSASSTFTPWWWLALHLCLFYVTSFTLVRGPTAAVLSVGPVCWDGWPCSSCFRPLEVLARVAFAVVVSKGGGDRSQLNTLTLAIPCYAFPLASATEASKPLPQALCLLCPPSPASAPFGLPWRGGPALQSSKPGLLCATGFTWRRACWLT